MCVCVWCQCVGGGRGVGGIRYWFTLRGGEYEWGKYDGTLANHWVGAPEGGSRAFVSVTNTV